MPALRDAHRLGPPRRLRPHHVLVPVLSAPPLGELAQHRERIDARTVPIGLEREPDCVPADEVCCGDRDGSLAGQHRLRGRLTGRLPAGCAHTRPAKGGSIEFGCGLVFPSDLDAGTPRGDFDPLWHVRHGRDDSPATRATRRSASVLVRVTTTPMSTPTLSIRPGHPAFLDLDWDRPLEEWDTPRLVEVPTGIHRHVVRFVAYDDEIYAIKELPLRTARHEYRALRSLGQRLNPVATVVGLVERNWVSEDREWSAAVMTQYVKYAFTYRELISGGNFGPRRNQMLDAVAGLLVELHLAGCFWGDCSLSNLLYRYDAGSIEAVMIDAETSELHDELSDGQRSHDLDIMTVNLAGGMADIAAEQGLDLDDADLRLGEDVASRYEALWSELSNAVLIGPHDGYQVRERVERLNALGFEVEGIDLLPVGDDQEERRLQLRVTVGGRNFHRGRLRELTGIDASEHQARYILADLRYYEASEAGASATGKAIRAIRWRVDVFEPLLLKIAADTGPDGDVVQRYCDYLHHRYRIAAAQQRDVPNDEAFTHWLEAGMPGYDLEIAAAEQGLDALD